MIGWKTWSNANNVFCCFISFNSFIATRQKCPTPTLIMSCTHNNLLKAIILLDFLGLVSNNLRVQFVCSNLTMQPRVCKHPFRGWIFCQIQLERGREKSLCVNNSLQMVCNVTQSLGAHQKCLGAFKISQTRWFNILLWIIVIALLRFDLICNYIFNINVFYWCKVYGKSIDCSYK